MGTDVQRWNGPSSPQELYLYAETLAGSGLLPSAFRKQPSNVFYACELGRALDIPAVTALSGIHVVEGRPSASAGLISALVRRDGHTLRVKTTGTVRRGDITVTAQLIRRDDPDWTFSATWDLDRAVRAGLIDEVKVDQDGRHTVIARTEKNKPSSWEKFTEAMLKARAISEVAREGAEDSLSGVRYTPEELGAEVDEDGVVVTPATVTVVSSTVVDEPERQVPQQRPVDPVSPAESADAALDAQATAAQRADEAPAPGLTPEQEAALTEAVRRVLDSDSVTDLQSTWRATAPAALTTDVTGRIPQAIVDAATVAGLGPADGLWTLGGLLTVCAKHLTTQGGMRLLDAATAEPVTGEDH
jgi:hypothetical protein